MHKHKAASLRVQRILSYSYTERDIYLNRHRQRDRARHLRLCGAGERTSVTALWNLAEVIRNQGGIMEGGNHYEPDRLHSEGPGPVCASKWWF